MSLQYDRLPQANEPQAAPQAVANNEQFVLVTPPAPTAEEFKQTIQRRTVEFNISRYVSEGWSFTKFNLLSFVGILLIYIVLGFALWVGYLTAMHGYFNWYLIKNERNWENGGNGGVTVWWEWDTRSILIAFGFTLVSFVLYVPLLGSLYQAVFNAMRANTTIRFKDFFSCFSCPYCFRLILLGLVLAFMRSVGFYLLIIPGIYFQIATMFSIPMHVEHGFLRIWDAVVLSCTIVNRYFCSVLAFIFCLGMLQVLGALCFLIGLFVTIPVAFCSICYCYHHLIGINGVAVMVPLAHLEGTPAPSTPVIELPAPSAPSASLV